MTKTYRLTYESVEVMHALFDRNSAKNRWRIGASILRSFIEYFGAGTEQLDIYSETGRATLTSYTEKIMDGKGLRAAFDNQMTCLTEYRDTEAAAANDCHC